MHILRVRTIIALISVSLEIFFVFSTIFFVVAVFVTTQYRVRSNFLKYLKNFDSICLNRYCELLFFCFLSIVDIVTSERNFFLLLLFYFILFLSVQREGKNCTIRRKTIIIFTIYRLGSINYSSIFFILTALKRFKFFTSKKQHKMFC